MLRSSNTQPYIDTCLPTEEPNQTQHWNDDEWVVAFFSCITAKQQDQRGKKRKRNEESPWDPFDSNENSEEEEEERLDSITPGLSFWIVYDYADVCSSVFANDMIKRFIDAKLDLAECKSISCRGMSLICFC